MKLVSFLGAIGLGIFTAAWVTSIQRRRSAAQAGGKRGASARVKDDGLIGFDLNSKPAPGVLNINEASQ